MMIGVIESELPKCDGQVAVVIVCSLEDVCRGHVGVETGGQGCVRRTGSLAAGGKQRSVQRGAADKFDTLCVDVADKAAVLA
ncbi:hypothetical protein, partial [Salmonella enterica]|uniref:hypothetical protein n=1 Tax=Salmonella enterica TaxID=28901 RepID=UPI00398C4C7F